MTLTRPTYGVRSFQYHSVDTLNSGPVLTSTVTVSGVAYPSANLAIYVPVRVLRRYLVRKLWVSTAATSTGNLDLGLYDADGLQLVATTSTAKVSSTEQVLDATDTQVGPGLFYMALSCSNNTDTFGGETDAAPCCASQGILTEALGGVDLPSTATWTVNQTLAFYPIMGMYVEPTVA